MYTGEVTQTESYGSRGFDYHLIIPPAMDWTVHTPSAVRRGRPL